MSAGQVHCLVTGATGYIGTRLVPQLLDGGHHVRALARNPKKLADVPWRERAEVARGDLRDVDSLIAAFDGIDVVYYLVHSMGTSKDFAAEEGRAVGNVVTAARRAGVRRVVYLSGLHPENSKLSPHLESRKAVGDALIDSTADRIAGMRRGDARLRHRQDHRAATGRHPTGHLCAHRPSGAIILVYVAALANCRDARAAMRRCATGQTPNSGGNASTMINPHTKWVSIGASTPPLARRSSAHTVPRTIAAKPSMRLPLAMVAPVYKMVEMSAG
jgi:uncharacterized protein YbjT (DUF2867 family)